VQNRIMCGIAGVVTGDASFGARVTKLMTDALARRGPDGSGLHTWPGATLGHRRLAIIDLSDAGKQPMLSSDQSVGVSFNGCIYNFQELRKELEARGHAFRSECDTEVLVEGYLEWGIDGLVSRIHGMYAFGIWDQPKQKFFLVRDRLGVKPACYAISGNTLAFASTAEALRMAGFAGPLNNLAIMQYLEFGFVPDTTAAFDGIQKLPPATVLEWSAGQATLRTYWQRPALDPNCRITFEEAVEHTEKLFLDAVRMRLIADVPIGVLLSGGVDSGLVCWALKELNANVTAFTVAATGDPEDETAAARETAQTLGIRHEVVDLPARTPALLDEVVAAYSEPFASPSALGMLLVSQAVSHSATVLLTGDGGDDVFLGYPFMYNAWRAQRLANAIPAPLASTVSLIGKSLPGNGGAKRARNFLSYSTEGLGAYIQAHDGIPWYRKHGVLGERFDGLEIPQRQIPASFGSARRLLEDYLDFHGKAHFLSEFMPKVDAATMYYSLEARAPMLDTNLWSYAAQLPFEVRFHNGTLKAILREIARRRIGNPAARRPKQGFTVPVERWLADKWSSALDGLKKSTELERDGWVRPGQLAGIVEEAKAQGYVSQLLYRLFILERWLQHVANPVAA